MKDCREICLCVDHWGSLILCYKDNMEFHSSLLYLVTKSRLTNDLIIL